MGKFIEMTGLGSGSALTAGVPLEGPTGALQLGLPVVLECPARKLHHREVDAGLPGELGELVLDRLVDLPGHGQLHVDAGTLGVLREGRWTPRRVEVVVHGVRW